MPLLSNLFAEDQVSSVGGGQTASADVTLDLTIASAVEDSYTDGDGVVHTLHREGQAGVEVSTSNLLGLDGQSDQTDIYDNAFG
jgi:hypothetical protein